MGKVISHLGTFISPSHPSTKLFPIDLNPYPANTRNTRLHRLPFGITNHANHNQVLHMNY